MGKLVLDFPPDDARLGGHIGEEDLIVGLLSFKQSSILVFYSRIPVRVIRFRYDIIFFSLLLSSFFFFVSLSELNTSLVRFFLHLIVRKLSTQ